MENIYKNKYILQFLNEVKDTLYIKNTEIILNYEFYNGYLDLTIINNKKEERTLLLDTKDKKIKRLLSGIDREIIEFKDYIIPLKGYIVYLANTFIEYCNKTNKIINDKEKNMEMIEYTKICINIMNNIDYYFFEEKTYKDNTDKWYYHTDNEIYEVVNIFELQLMVMLNKYRVSYMDESQYVEEFNKNDNPDNNIKRRKQ